MIHCLEKTDKIFRYLPSKSIQFMDFLANDILLGQQVALMMNSTVNQTM